MRKNLVELSLDELHRMVDVRLDKLRHIDEYAYDRLDAYLDRFWYDHASLIEFIIDFDNGIYN